jgi:hypothetical protein
MGKNSHEKIGLCISYDQNGMLCNIKYNIRIGTNVKEQWQNTELSRDLVWTECWG